MSQGFHQVQKLAQSMVLAPQLRQSLKILQAAALDLRTTILEELQTNPALEELPMEGVSLEERLDSPASEDGPAPDQEMEFGDKNFEILQQLDEDWRDHFAQESAMRTFSSEDAERRQHFFDSLTSETSLQEHLMRQAELTEASPQTLRALEFILGSLDDRGFLNSPLADVALLASLPLRTVQEALTLLKTLEPVGLGSVDLRECLLTQLEHRRRGQSVAARIVRQHFDLLLRRRLPDLARKLGVEVDEIHTAVEEIAELDPAPGRRFSEDNNRVVVPDVKVERDGDQWLITLNQDYIPRLRLSSTYKEMIAKGKLSAQERDYLKEKLRSGKFLISSIEQRQQTIERITREILFFQGDFFAEGVSKLHPLTMSQVAEAVGVHETTVSRAIANKYIETPHGVFDFKYFFTPGYTSGDGQSMSNTSIKEMIQKIIDGENPAKPFSDQEVVGILKDKDITIARRTVAKYREELGILPTNLRRQYG